MPLNPHNRLLVALLLFLHLWGWPDPSRDEGGGGPNAHNQKRAANGQPVYSKHGAGSPAFGNIPVEFCPAPGADVCIESKFSMLVSSDTCILTRCSFVWLLPLCQMFGPGGNLEADAWGLQGQVYRPHGHRRAAATWNEQGQGTARGHYWVQWFNEKFPFIHSTFQHWR